MKSILQIATVREGFSGYRLRIAPYGKLKWQKYTEISMYALQGEINSSTIRLEGVLKEKPVSILVDSSSSHNFIQIDIAKNVKLEISPIAAFNVVTGSGTKLECNKIYRQAKLRIEGLPLQVDL